MTKSQVNQLLALMKVNYSYAFRQMSDREKYLMLDAWTIGLSDIDATIVFLAVMKLFTTSKWLPTIAEIRKKAQSMYYEAEYADRDSLDVHTRALFDEIAEKTAGLRGDDAPEISLESMLKGAATLNGLTDIDAYSRLNDSYSAEHAYERRGLEDL